MNKPQTLLFVAVALVAIGIGLFVQSGQRTAPTDLSLDKIILLPQPKEIGDVRFTNHLGKPFSKENLLGKWSILFFGFTNCPDICPTTLQTLAQVKATLEAQQAWKPYQVIMISVDPERDSIERMNSYVPWFDNSFIGLAGELEYTRQFAKNLGVLFFKSQQSSDTVYEVDHSASLILVNPQGQYAGAITAPHKHEVIANDLKRLAQTVALANDSSTADAVDLTKPDTSASQITSALSFSQAWIRPAPPSASSLAAYMILENRSEQDIVIVDVEAPDFAMAMIHDTVFEEDIASMRHLDELRIPAGQQVKLTPLSTHMMLMRPAKPFPEGSFTRITLIDEDDRSYPLLVEVKKTSE